MLIPLAMPAHGAVDHEIHKLCQNAKDYSGCVKTQTGAEQTPSRITVDQGLATNEGNSCPVGFANRGGGYCTEPFCWGKGKWIFGEKHDPALAGKEWECKGGGIGSGGVLRWGETTQRGFYDKNCPAIPFEIGWQNTCNQEKGAQSKAKE